MNTQANKIQMVEDIPRNIKDCIEVELTYNQNFYDNFDYIDEQSFIDLLYPEYMRDYHLSETQAKYLAKRLYKLLAFHIQ